MVMEALWRARQWYETPNIQFKSGQRTDRIVEYQGIRGPPGAM